MDRPEPPIPPLSEPLAAADETDAIELLTREAGLLDTSVGCDTMLVTRVTVVAGVTLVVVVLELGKAEVVVGRTLVVVLELTTALLDVLITTGVAVVDEEDTTNNHQPNIPEGAREARISTYQQKTMSQPPTWS